MDTLNRFHTPSTFRLVRAEALLLITVMIALLLAFSNDVRWGRFCIAFLLIDVLGYLPGALAFRRAARKQGSHDPLQPTHIAPIYHHLYNVTHSFLTTGAVIAIWYLWRGEPEWAMFALPIHLLGDRGIFGNTYKPAALPFEPVAALPRAYAAQLHEGSL